MINFAANEKIEHLAAQTLHYDRYAERWYFLERVEVDGKYGLICGERSDEYGVHTNVLLPPIYDEIKVSKISSHKAIYDRYVVFTNGIQVAQFTLVLNAWVPILSLNKASTQHRVSHN